MLILLCLFSGVSVAQEGPAVTLKIALSSAPTSADPHYHKLAANDALSTHIYGYLVDRAPDMSLIPSIATSWVALDDHTWQFNLREDVKFSNGEPLTSEDVLFTICRTLNNPTNVASSYTDTRRIVDVVAPDRKTVNIVTRDPYPLLPAQLARSLPILWSGIVAHEILRFDPVNGCGAVGAWPEESDFNSGKAAIGSGPYMLRSFERGIKVSLTRNPYYQGELPPWQSVDFTVVPNEGTRMAGLLAGDFDFIENPSPRDIPRIKSDNRFAYSSAPSTRVIFLQPDVGRNSSPKVQGANGENPLRKLQVRQAISMAIDRKAIVEKIMSGMAVVANQYSPDGSFGALDRTPALQYDPAQARQLLADAGFPSGFSLTLSSPAGRYINDEKVALAVAQFLSRAGIRTTVDTFPPRLFFPKRARHEFSLSLGSWASDTGEVSSLLGLWMLTNDPINSLGTSNYGGFIDESFEVTFRKAIQTTDSAQRERLLKQATGEALEQLPLIPLYFESTLWAFRSDLSYVGRRDQATLAAHIIPLSR